MYLYVGPSIYSSIGSKISKHMKQLYAFRTYTGFESLFFHSAAVVHRGLKLSEMKFTV